MNSKIQAWHNHPVTMVLVKVLEEKQKNLLEEALSSEDDSKRSRLLDKMQVYRDLLDFENFFDGELDEVEA